MYNMGSFESRLDAHITGGNYHKVIIDCKCKNGHTWEALGFSEYGMIEFSDENDSICPDCNELDMECE